MCMQRCGNCLNVILLGHHKTAVGKFTDAQDQESCLPDASSNNPSPCFDAERSEKLLYAYLIGKKAQE